MLFFIKKEKIYSFIFIISMIISFSVVYPIDTLLSTSATPLAGKVIVIDAGHGHTDSGAIGYSGVMEKDLNLSIAKKAGSYLQQLGAIVIYTRQDDGSLLNNRNAIARGSTNKKKDMYVRKYIRDNSDADIFISIHMNYFSDSEYSGAQIFYNDLNTESQKLAFYIQNSFKTYVNPLNNRETKASRNIYVLNESSIPSVLIECGFISNYDEELKLKDDNYQNNIAFAICNGIIYFYQNT